MFTDAQKSGTKKSRERYGNGLWPIKQIVLLKEIAIHFRSLSRTEQRKRLFYNSPWLQLRHRKRAPFGYGYAGLAHYVAYLT